LLEKNVIKEKISKFKAQIKQKHRIISTFKKDDIQSIKKILISNVNK